MDAAAYTPGARKLLSFTDNRQDASLQAGHFNDFVEVGLLRSALYRAVVSGGLAGVGHDELAQRVFDELGFPFADYAHDPGVRGNAREQTDAAMREVIAYRLYRDLRRGWRILAPNLEQAGLLRIEYLSLDEACADEEIWRSCHPALSGAAPETRGGIARTLLDFMRQELAIRVDYLETDYQERMLQRSHQQLGPPWGFDENETLRSLSRSSLAYPRSRRPGEASENTYLSSRGRVGRLLRRRATLPHYESRLSMEETSLVICQLLEALRRYGIVTNVSREPEEDPAYQLSASVIRWHAGDGTHGLRDPIRQPTESAEAAPPNPFFVHYYRHVAPQTRGIRAREHTAQVPSEVREDRERRFRTGELPILFCSPTMELGIDIAELNAVNLRNVPPTPANYAQRSGRAGRSGQAALVFTYCSGGSPHDQYFFRHPEAMVAGIVSPPPIELTNEDLLRAHVHALWLAESGLKLGKTLADVLDLTSAPPADRFQPHVLDALADRGAVRRTRDRATRILETLRADLIGADWFRDDWLDGVLDAIPSRLERACDRWRDLYRAAYDQARRQGEIALDASRSPQDKARAQRLRREAEMQLALLTDPASVAQSDFYSYRYFASEGFLPGYNFPRLPLSAFIPGRARRAGEEEFLSRPRFLAISEFGPRAIVYHEGSQYVISQVMLPAGSVDDIDTTEAKVCEACGYLHAHRAGEGPDRCELCGAELPPPWRRLFRLQNVSTKRRERITCDEEERLRMGFDLRTAVRFAERDGRLSYRAAQVLAAGRPLLSLEYGQAADLWRVNLGWRRRRPNTSDGFLLDVERGLWAKHEDEADDDEPLHRVERVIPFVQDTKNCLVLRPSDPLPLAVMASLQAALKTAIQLAYELEDRELAVEPLPDAENRKAILLYEATEGGLGALRRLISHSGELARIARVALDLCHFDPETGEDRRRAAHAREDCEAACYDCLLSYTNQRDHDLLDRMKIRDLLMTLGQARVDLSPSPLPRNDHVQRLLRVAGSQLERRWLQYLADGGFNLPSSAQTLFERCGTRPDFVYESQNAVVYVDGPAHDHPERACRDRQQSECMEDAGWIVIRFVQEAGWDAVLERHKGIFGGRS